MTTVEPSNPESVDADPTLVATLPSITINELQERDLIDAAWAAIDASNAPPRLFDRGGAPSRLRIVEGTCTAEPVTVSSMKENIARSADWFKVRHYRGEEFLDPAPPPRDLASMMLATPSSRNPLPKLRRIVQTPVFSDKFQLISTPGYSTAEELWYEPHCYLKVPNIDTVRPAEVAWAKRIILKEVLGDFPFASDSDRAHAVGLLMLSFVRDMIKGATPMHGLEASCPGTGKNLYCDCVSIVSFGSPCAGLTVGRDDLELTRTLTSAFVAGREMIMFDNVEELNSGTLAAAITLGIWTDRLLGTSKMVALPVRPIWMLTGNNPVLSKELQRRYLRIRLVAQQECPWDRPPSSFRHQNLQKWVREHRSEIVTAILIIVRTWILAGQPQASKSLGGFEEWSAVIGGILETVGIDGFLQNSAEQYEIGDDEGFSWKQLFDFWWSAHADNWTPFKDIFSMVVANSLLTDVLGEKSEKSKQSKLGKALTKKRDGIVAGYQLERRTDSSTKSREYRIRKTDT